MKQKYRLSPTLKDVWILPTSPTTLKDIFVDQVLAKISMYKQVPLCYKNQNTKERNIRLVVEL